MNVEELLGKIGKSIFICEILGTSLKEDKIRENCLRWYGYMLGRPTYMVVKRGEMIRYEES